MNLIRIDKLFNFEKGSLQSSKCVAGDYNFITASAKWKTHYEYTYETEALVFAAAASGSLGRTHYVNGKFIASDLCFVLSPKDPANLPIDLQFYHIIFNSLRDDIVKNTKSGTSKEAIGLASFGKYEIPYIAIDRQNEIKNQIVTSVEVKEKLTSELTSQLDLIKILRQQILQDAVNGKLVPQDPKDETASKLLERIKAEKEQLIKRQKIKKDRQLTEINPEEEPFEIPNGWVWCRGEDIAEFIDPQPSHRTPPESLNGIPYVSMKDISDNGNIDFTFARKVNPAILLEHNKRYTLQVGDFIFGKIGTIGKPVWLTAPFNYTLSANLILIQGNRLLLNERFLFYFLSSPMAEKHLYENKSDMSYPVFGMKKARLMPIPLPPLREQQRIVTKMELLMNLCDELEQTIQQNQKYTQELLKVALKEALELKT
jgi:type I restriction enzyme, S subunit